MSIQKFIIKGSGLTMTIMVTVTDTEVESSTEIRYIGKGNNVTSLIDRAMYITRHAAIERYLNGTQSVPFEKQLPEFVVSSGVAEMEEEVVS